MLNGSDEFSAKTRELDVTVVTVQKELVEMICFF